MSEATPAKEKSPNPQHSSAPSWDSRTSLLMGVGFTLLLIVLGVVFWPVIPLALATSVIAYLLNPITNFFDQRVTFGRRGWSILLTFLFIIVVIVLVLVMLIPPLVEQSISSITSLYNSGVQLVTEPSNVLSFIRDPETDEVIALSEYISILLRDQGFTTVNEWFLETSRNLELDRDTILQIFNIGGGVTTSVLGSVFSIAGEAVGLVFTSLFFLTILASLLNGGNSIPKSFVSIMPDGYEDDAGRLLSDLGGVWNGYVRGNFTLGLIMGSIMWVLALIMGLPNPLFLAFVAFSMEFIPNIGPTISMVAAVALALVGGSSTFPDMNPFLLAGIITVIWVIMQQLEAIVLVPRIVGENLQLHPAIVILSVIWGGSFGGLIGIVIAPPLVASIRIILQYIYGRLTGREAFLTHNDPPDNLRVRGQRMLSNLFKRGKSSDKPEAQAESDTSPETA
ncbi:MAG: AI-2E family transporter [Anaerolineae bacterium]